MERSKVLLEKIESKKITERYKLDVPKKESEKFKSKLSVRDKVSKEQNPVDISAATYQDLLKIYPRNIDTSKFGSQEPHEGLKTHEICEVSEDKYNSGCFLFQPNRPKSPHQAKLSTSSISSLSSFVFFDTESSVQTPNYDTLTEESDASFREECDENLKGLHAESLRRPLCDNSDGSCYNQLICERHASKEDAANGKMTIQDSVTEKRTAVVNRYSDEDDLEIDSRENSIRVQDKRTLSLSDEEDPIKELRNALENSANCLLRCLKSLQNASPRKDKLHLIGDSCMKFDCSMPECKCREMDLNDLITERDENASLRISHISKSKSDSDAKRRIDAAPCHSPKSIHTDTTKSEYCSCDCCNRKCFHFQSTRRHLSDDVLEISRMSRKKMTINLSKGDFANHLLTPDDPMKISRSSYEKNDLCLLPSSDFPISVRKETDSVKNETRVDDNSRLIHRSNAGENKQPFKSYSAPLEKSNLIEDEQNVGHHHKNKNKSKTGEMHRGRDQCEKHVEDNDTKVDSCDTVTMLFLGFPFIMFFCFILYIYYFIR